MERFMPKGSNPNSLANLRAPFSSTDQPRNNRAGGRKPSSLKKFIKKTNISSDDISNMIKYILPMNQDQITELLQDKKTPLIMRIFANAVLRDLKNGNLNNVKDLMDRSIGKPQEHHHHTGEVSNTNHNIDYSSLSDDEAKTLWHQTMNPDKE